jgi:hypothetical protein
MLKAAAPGIAVIGHERAYEVRPPPMVLPMLRRDRFAVVPYAIAADR